MKKLILSIVFSLALISAWGQISFKKTDILLNYKEDRLVKFIGANHIKYALVAWAEGPWSLKDDYTLLIEKHHKWHLVQISAGDIVLTERKRSVEIKQRELKKEEVNGLLDSLQIDTAFRYSQKEFDAVPEACEYELNGEKVFIKITDINYLNLMRFSGKKIEKLTRYGANYYLQNCYPYEPKYNIFLGFVHTYNMLTAEMKSKSEPKLKSSKTEKP